MDRNLHLKYLMGSDRELNAKLQSLEKHVKQIDGWTVKFYIDWGSALTVRCVYSSVHSPYHIDLVELFTYYAELLKTQGLSSYLQTAEVMQVYKASMKTKALPTEVDRVQFQAVAEYLNKKAHGEDSCSPFNCIFHCISD